MSSGAARPLSACGCCFALLVWIWHAHDLFFRRYGLQDGYTVFLNAALLFMVLLHHPVSAAVGAIALLVALAGPLRLAFLSPMCFGLVGPAHVAFGTLAARRRGLERSAGTRAPV